jgi:hypothetical protein
MTQTAQGTQFGSAVDFGGGSLVVGMSKATTNPNTTSTGSVAYADHTSGDFAVKSPGSSSADLDVGHATIGVGQQLGGLGTVPLDLATTTGVACGTGGTVTISAAQAITPRLAITTSGSLTSNCVLAFGTNANSGLFFLDFVGATGVGATFGLQVTNGSYTSPTLTSTLNTALGGGGLGVLSLRGANTGSINW